MRRTRSFPVHALVLCIAALVMQPASAQDLAHLFDRSSFQQSDARAVLLSDVLDQLKARDQVRFVYESRLVKGVRVRSGIAAGESVEEVLDRILPALELTYLRLRDDTYTILSATRSETDLRRAAAARPEPLLASTAPAVKQAVLPAVRLPIMAAPQLGAIGGTVIEAETEQPLPGVNVVIQGTTIGATTDSDGSYLIEGVEPGTYTVQATFVGFRALAMENVQVVADQTTELNFELEESTIDLDEVLVVGYGTQTRSDVTGAVSSVKSEQLAAQPVARLSHALQGRAAGVEVVNTDAQPGGGVRVRIRGGTSINAGSDPLYVVDGFAGADINDISPEDIESIEILKDASATAIYGARGANGVVMITTKSGRPGEPRITFKATPYSYRTAINTLEVLNARQFAEYMNDVRINDGEEPLYDNPSALGEGTDHLDTILRDGSMQEYQLSVAGGSDNVTYYVSGNVYDETGLIINSSYKRYALRTNIDIAATDWLQVGTRVFGSRSLRDGTNVFTGASSTPAHTASALRYNPILGVYDEDGNYTVNDIGDPHGPAYSMATEVIEDDVDDRVQGNVFGEIDITPELSARVSFGADYLSSRFGFFDPTRTFTGGPVGGSAEISNTRRTTLLSENYLSYNNSFGIHELDTQAGYSYQTYSREASGAEIEGFPTDAFTYYNLGSGSTLLPPDSDLDEWELESYYGRINYGLLDRYLLTFTARYDGSSRFASNNKYAFFPSGALAWVVSREPFMEDLDAVGLLKLRASYGVTGNTEIGVYRSLAALESQFSVIGGQIVNGIVPDQVANSNLSWESTTQLDIGVDLGLWQDRLLFSADYYHMKTDDLLLAVDLPEYSGFTSSLQNVGVTQNRGFEFELTSYNIDRGLTWMTSVNFTLNRNEVVELVRQGEPNEDGSYDNDIPIGGAPGHMLIPNVAILREGEPIGVFYGLISDGVDPDTGEEIFRDINGDGNITNSDRTIIGNPNPDYLWGLDNTFSYGGFDLNVFFTASIGNDLLNFQRIELEDVRGSFNQSIAVLDRWTPENRDTDIPKASTGNTRRVSTRFVEDGSYIRMRNISLAYRLPSRLLSRFGADTARLVLSGQNLLTFTDYSGWDPEVNTEGGSNTQIGLDYGAYPRAKAVTFTVQLGL